MEFGGTGTKMLFIALFVIAVALVLMMMDITQTVTGSPTRTISNAERSGRRLVVPRGTAHETAHAKSLPIQSSMGTNNGAVATKDVGSKSMLPGGIQKIVHQTWKVKDLYPNQAKWRDNCKRINPDWEFRIYTDDDNRKLVQEHYPWFLATYDSYPKNINRIDAIRIFYLAHFGGVYMDLDYTCLRPFDDILTGASVVVAEDELPHRQGKIKNILTKRENLLGIGNSFLAAAKGSAVFERATHRLQEVRNKVRDETGNLAGVWFIRELIEEYRPDKFEQEKIRIMPLRTITPMHWVEVRHHNDAAKMCTEFVDLDKCRRRFPNATTVSFWTGTWQVTGPHSNPSTKLSADRSKQILLGLRKEGDRSTKTLRELEAAANYTGPSGDIRIF